MVEPEVSNTWCSLKAFTSARIAQVRAGIALPTRANLAFQLDHARARDAVHRPLDVNDLEQQLTLLQRPLLQVHSQAEDRRQYLQRPDLGRRLNQPSRDQLLKTSLAGDLVIVIADGLSSTAITDHALGFLSNLLPVLANQKISLAPLVIAQQARVALGDDIASALGAKMSLVLIGERPGLTSPNSLGLYLTYNPHVGCMDAQRNCISNIRPPEGLSYEAAADTCWYLIRNALDRKVSGIELKDDSVVLENNESISIPFFKESTEL